MAGARLRKAFKYPSDYEGDEARDELDEQEQEMLIDQLRKENEKSNTQFKLLFTFLPLPCIFPFVLCMWDASNYASSSARVLLCLLGITSLLSTAYTSHSISLPKLDSKQGAVKLRSFTADDKSPIEKYLPYLNVGICLLLFLAAWVLRGTGAVGTQSEFFWLWCLVPGAIFSMVTFGRKTMTDVDIDELEKLKYNYKGA